MIKDGQKISIRYDMFAEDGTLAASNKDDKTAQDFFLGRGQLMPALEDALRDMEVGDIKRVELKPEEAFGNFDERLSKIVHAHKVPEKHRAIGNILDMEDNEGHICSARVHAIDLENNKITLDFNHPLAGQKISFVVERIA